MMIISNITSFLLTNALLLLGLILALGSGLGYGVVGQGLLHQMVHIGADALSHSSPQTTEAL